MKSKKKTRVIAWSKNTRARRERIQRLETETALANARINSEYLMEAAFARARDARVG